MGEGGPGEIGCCNLFLFQPGEVSDQEEEDDLPSTPKSAEGGNEEEMRAQARGFYGRLFGAEHCSLQSHEELLEGLPQLRTDLRGTDSCSQPDGFFLGGGSMVSPRPFKNMVLRFFGAQRRHSRKNWERVKENVCTGLVKWKWLQPQLS